MGWNTWHQGAGSGSHFWGHCSWSSHCINAPGDRHSCRRNAEQVTGPEHDQYSRRGDPIPGLVSTYIQDQDTLFPGGGNVYQTTCQPGHPEINHLGWTGLYMRTIRQDLQDQTMLQMPQIRSRRIPMPGPTATLRFMCRTSYFKGVPYTREEGATSGRRRSSESTWPNSSPQGSGQNP